MKYIRTYFKWIPETFFAIVTLVYWIVSADGINPIALGLLLLLGILVLIRGKVLPSILLGSTLAMLYVMSSLYLFMAVISGYSEFPSSARSTTQQIIIGAIIFGSSFIMGIVMLVKYINYSSKIQPITD